MGVDQDGSQSLSEFLAEEGAHLKFLRTRDRTPVVEITLPDPQEPPPTQITCEVDGGTMSLATRTNGFPFPERGLIVSFRKEAVYICTDCGMPTPADALQRRLMGDTLQRVTRQLAAKGIENRPPSPRSIRRALQ